MQLDWIITTGFLVIMWLGLLTSKNRHSADILLQKQPRKCTFYVLCHILTTLISKNIFFIIILLLWSDNDRHYGKCHGLWFELNRKLLDICDFHLTSVNDQWLTPEVLLVQYDISVSFFHTGSFICWFHLEEFHVQYFQGFHIYD